MVATRKGFISVYALVLLDLILVFISFLMYKTKLNLYGYEANQDLIYAELYAIKTIKEELLAYEEENHDIYYEDYVITLSYDDIVCDFKIHKDNVVYLEAVIEFDDIDELFVSYEYK